MSQNLSTPRNFSFIKDFTELSPDDAIPPLIFLENGFQLRIDQTIKDDSIPLDLLNFKRPDEEALIKEFYENPRNEAALRAVEQILENDSVTLEGTPLYVERPRDESHEIGYNCILQDLHEVLIQEGKQVIHTGLFDEYSGSDGESEFDISKIEAPNAVKFDTFKTESELVDSADSLLEILTKRGLTFEKEGAIYLNSGSKPILQDEEGKYSCPLLDAVFQMQKSQAFENSEASEITNVIIHPVEFKSQQENARSIMRAGYEFENINTLETRIQAITNDLILPNIPEEKREAMGERLSSQFSKLSEKYDEKWNRMIVLQGIRKMFHYFLKEEKKNERFIGLSKSLESALEGFKNYEFPAQTINIFFDGSEITQIQAHNTNGKRQNVQF